jgi:hypothetical protein
VGLFSLFSLIAQSFSQIKAPGGGLISLFSHKVHSFSESFAGQLAVRNSRLYFSLADRDDGIVVTD